MDDKKHLICTLCTEPRCLENDCIFHSYPRELARGMKSLTEREKHPPNKPIPVVKNKSIPVPRKDPIDFRFLPAYFRGGQTTRQPVIKQEKRYIVCYVCDEPRCLEEECLFLTDPRDITRGLKHYISFVDMPFGKDRGKITTGGVVKQTPVNLLYINAVKLFWFCVVIGAILYLVVFGGLSFLSVQFLSIQSQLPLQVYLSVFGIGVTIVSLAMANLFGTESKAAR